MALWWNDSLVLVMEREDVKILREMDFIARSLISKKYSRPQSHYEKRISHIREKIIYSKNKEKIAPAARYF